MRQLQELLVWLHQLPNELTGEWMWVSQKKPASSMISPSIEGQKHINYRSNFKETTCGWLQTDWLPGCCVVYRRLDLGWGPGIYKQPIRTQLEKDRWGSGTRNSHIFLTGKGLKWLWTHRQWCPFKLERCRLWCNFVSHVQKKEPTKEREKRIIRTQSRLQGIRRCQIEFSGFCQFFKPKKPFFTTH